MTDEQYDKSEFYRFDSAPTDDEEAALRAADDQLFSEAVAFIRANPKHWWLCGYEDADDHGFNGYTVLSSLEGSGQEVFEFFLRVTLDAIDGAARGLDIPAGVIAVKLFQYVLAEVAVKHIPDPDDE